ncbi:hypothetical protein [Streptomyces sp. NPDC051684]|uniref:hypothetical protein n=1 Tax=Streptomyces sp. NPDC051684 TaxID=3365670 RepID=UPI00379AD627
MCDAVVHKARGEEWVAAEELLDLDHPGGAGESVIRRLLDTLVGSENHDELCLLSLAWDREAAEQLAERWVPRTIDDLAAADGVAAQLERERWSRGPGSRPFITDRFLRALLVHQMRSGRGAGGVGWGDAHGLLAQHHRRRAEGRSGRAGRDEWARFLWHRLAGGETQEVVDRLHAEFGRPEGDALEWLRALRTVAHAPPARRPLVRALPGGRQGSQGPAAGAGGPGGEPGEAAGLPAAARPLVRRRRARRGGPAAGRADRAGPVVPVRPAPDGARGPRPGGGPPAARRTGRRGPAAGAQLGRRGMRGRRTDRRNWPWLPRRLRFRVFGQHVPRTLIPTVAPGNRPMRVRLNACD